MLSLSIGSGLLAFELHGKPGQTCRTAGGAPAKFAHTAMIYVYAMAAALALQIWPVIGHCLLGAPAPPAQKGGWADSSGEDDEDEDVR